VALGNGLLTRYAYEGRSFRLLRQRTQGVDVEQVAGASVTYVPRSGTVRQDTGYGYDLAGNIVAQTERAPGSGAGGSNKLAK
jgi:YD repeat-containing protein